MKRVLKWVAFVITVAVAGSVIVLVYVIGGGVGARSQPGTMETFIARTVRDIAIAWHAPDQAQEYGEFVFFARNPNASQVAWKVRQRFADGTSADWVGVEGDRRPASVTKLTPATTR